MERAIVTGVTGQDGSILAEQLLDAGWSVHGIVRRSSSEPAPRLHTLRGRERFHVHRGNMVDGESLNRIMRSVEPDAVWNYAAQSHVGTSFDVPLYTQNVTGMGFVRLLEAIRRHAPDARVYQASSSEMFGPQLDADGGGRLSEEDDFQPISPYAVSKVHAHHAAQCWRDAYGLDITTGIMFNHESPRRGTRFVTRKITRTLARIQVGDAKRIELGNLNPVRDWGWAPEYVDIARRLLTEDHPADDYVVATGRGWSVRDFLEAVHRQSSITAPLDHLVTIRDDLYRPADIPRLVGDSTKLEEETGMSVEHGPDDVARRMFQADLEDVQDAA